MIKLHYILVIIIILLASCKGTPTVSYVQSGTTTLLLDGQTVGCGFFVVYKSTQDKTKSVMVSGEKGDIELSKTPRTFDIENTPGLEVRFDDYGEAQHGWLCEASVPHGRILQRSRATTGKITMFITREKVRLALQPRAYAITVILEDVTFRLPNGSSYYVEKAEMEDVVVGTMSG